MAAVSPQTILCGIERLSPAGSVVEAATSQSRWDVNCKRCEAQCILQARKERNRTQQWLLKKMRNSKNGKNGAKIFYRWLAFAVFASLTPHRHPRPKMRFAIFRLCPPTTLTVGGHQKVELNTINKSIIFKK